MVLYKRLTQIYKHYPIFMSKPLLQLSDVSISFDRKKTYILKDICFSLWKGAVMSIIWMNGTGKSTLLKIIAGIQEQTSGTIIRNYKKLWYVPQKIDVDMTFPLTVREFINIYNIGVSDSTIKNMLNKFDSKKILETQIAHLSGGEFQKMLIVSALMSEPDLLLLDEPTSWIDALWEKVFYQNISEVKKVFPELSIILVSHNLHLVYKNSDTIICLHSDNFCCHGTPAEIGNNKDVKEIWWDLVVPYKHKPHEKHIH